MLLLRSSRSIAQRAIPQPLRCARSVSTLPNNPHIYAHPDPITSTTTLSLLPTSPPTPSLAIGTAPSNGTLPPAPQDFHENPSFLGILQSVLAAHAVHDPYVKSQAAAYASQAGSTLGGGGAMFNAPSTASSSSSLPHNHPAAAAARQAAKRARPSRGPGSVGGGGGGSTTYSAYGGGGGAGGDGAGGASAQGGVGGAGRGGWVHVSDMRNPPDYGRIAWPEDIFGSVEVDGRGQFVGANGNYQESGTYRVCTREGFLGLSPYLRERLVERLKELEAQMKGGR